MSTKPTQDRALVDLLEGAFYPDPSTVDPADSMAAGVRIAIYREAILDLIWELFKTDSKHSCCLPALVEVVRLLFRMEGKIHLALSVAERSVPSSRDGIKP